MQLGLCPSRTHRAFAAQNIQTSRFAVEGNVANRTQKVTNARWSLVMPLELRGMDTLSGEGPPSSFRGEGQLATAAGLHKQLLRLRSPHVLFV